MSSEALIGLCQMDLPSGTVRLCDGGYVTWGGNTFKAKDATYGSLASVRSLGEGVGDQIPALEMVLQPAASATAGSLVQPTYQKSRIRFWIANFNTDTAAVTGTPSLVFDGFYDQAILGVGKTRRDLAITVVSLLEQLFEGNIGNRLSPAFHKSVWPGETGHDNATGLNRNIAWGTEAPPSNATPSGGAWMAPTIDDPFNTLGRF